MDLLVNKKLLDDLVRAGDIAYGNLLKLLSQKQVPKEMAEVSTTLLLPESFNFSCARIRFSRPRNEKVRGKVRFFLNVALLPRANGETNPKYLNIRINPFDGGIDGDVPDSRSQTAALRTTVLNLLIHALDVLSVGPVFMDRARKDQAQPQNEVRAER